MRATVAFAVIALAGAQPAQAQWVVTDPAHMTQTALGWAQQARDSIAQLQQLQQQYMMVTRTYNAISHATDVGGIASALGGVTRTYLPEASGAVSMIGSASRMFGNAGSYRSADQLYLPQAMQGVSQAERWLSEMGRRQDATANAKAIADAGIIDMESRIASLSAAELRLAAARDGTEVAAVNGLISTSRANIEMHRASVENIRLALHAEDRTERQRGEQMQAMGANQWMENMQASVDALGSD